MKKIVLSSLLALFLAFPVFAQRAYEIPRLSDTVMEELVKEILIWNFIPRSRPTEIKIAAQNIKKEWLPKINNVEFVIVSAEEYFAVSELYFFELFERRGKNLRIGFGYGDPHCDRKGHVWYFRLKKGVVTVPKLHGEFSIRCHYRY